MVKNFLGKNLMARNFLAKNPMVRTFLVIRKRKVEKQKSVTR
jgi:hypothetical protein